LKIGGKNIFQVLIAVGLLTTVWASRAHMLPKGGEYVGVPTYIPLPPAFLPTTILPTDSPDVDLPYPIEDNLDPSQSGGSGIDFEDPLNIQSNVEYDPTTGNYIFTQTIGDSVDYRPPSYMTLDEYLEWQMAQSIERNWQESIDDTNEDSKNPLSKEFGGNRFRDIFGDNTVQIRPNGTAELTFGVNSSKTDNPQLPEKQRRITTFDFNERIQLNVTGTIGTKLQLNTSYNTEATFDFENQLKLEYAGNEDEIIQKIEAGNVSLPLNGSLITGSQSLFGIKTELKFGRLTATTVFSQQKGQRKEIETSGGAQVSEYEITADKYEANRHYFLSMTHRNNYDNAMASLPVVNSGVNITRIEVWVTNTNNTTTNTRNIVALTDLGEIENLQSNTIAGSGAVTVTGGATLADNQSNNIYGAIENNANVRGFVGATTELSNAGNGAPFPFQPSVNYEKVENARMLSQQEFTYNAMLGFVSLNQALNNDEVLAVAYQYTYQGGTYQVGEFSTDGIAGQDALYLKLLKGTITNPTYKMWDLMMKNVYSIGAYQVNQENFRLDVWYNNPTTSVDINYIPRAGIDTRPLVQVLSLDKLNQQSASSPDGVFDFVPIAFNGNLATSGGTINTQNGRIFFTTVEPFGSYLEQQMLNAGIDPNIIAVTVYQALYDSTKTAAQQIPELNRFKLKGSYQSASSSEISLNALNVPQGSVTVTAGGVQLTENVDYTVDYNLGRVKIINQGLLESQTPIKISLESNSLFNIQTKTLMGTHLDYRINKDFNVGGTVLNLTERPLTQKINIGDEPISNTMLGLDGNYRTEAPFITKLVDKLPFIDTKEMSNITASAEYAQLIPGHSRAIGKDGISYIDDFEGSQSAIDIRSFNQWVIASTPKGQPALFPEGDLNNDRTYGVNRAKTSWYVIDPLFFRDNNLTPDHISGNTAIQNNHNMREVLEGEVFPNRQLAAGTPTNIPVFDVAYYPTERGPYNFDTTGVAGISSGLNSDGTLRDPDTRWGGIMRDLTTNDFEAANIEFIQFWVMSPFNVPGDQIYNADAVNTSGGDLYFNLGNISEDILSDSRKSFENGLPTSTSFDPADVAETEWSRVSTQQVVVNAFDNDLTSRIFQDVGFDGLSDADETDFFSTFVNWANNGGITNSTALAEINADPANDNYNYYRDDNYDSQQLDILNRYKRYNGSDGNSPTSDFSETLNSDGYPTSATTLPDVEDINQDNNLTENESYFQYRVSMRPQDMQVGQNYITDKLVTVSPRDQRQITWFQFKIPVREPDNVVNGIQDFRSIRFIRMFMKGFDEPMVLRFARLELIRGEWRRYLNSLAGNGEYVQDDPPGTVFNISAVNVEENGNRQPINYVIPPGINQEVDVATANLRKLNEQSLTLEVCGLEDGDARAAYRNVGFDVRSYLRLQMYIHAESQDELESPLNDDDVTVFVRLGSDFNNNYYEYEMPVKVTPWGTSNESAIWPEANNLDIEFAQLTKVKKSRNEDIGSSASITQPYIKYDPNYPDRKITVVGNPNLQGLRTIMIGVRNPHKDDPNPWKPDNGLDQCVEIWVNELRLTDFDEIGGWAAQARMNANLADFGNIALAGSISTPGFGSIEKRVSERQRETNIQFDASSNFELGQFFGEKIGLKIPLYLGYSEGWINPQFDPLNPDILFNESLDGLEVNEKAKRLREGQTYNKRRSINLTNVRLEKGKKGGKSHFWDPSNISATYSYNEAFMRDINTERALNKTYRGGLTYAFNANPKPFQPFKNVKAFKKSKWFRLVKDFNLYLKPKQIAFRTDVNRTYNEHIIRSNLDAIIIPQYTKTFNWNRVYDVKYDITKALKVDFNALNNAIIGEPDGRVDKEFADEYQTFKDSVNKSVQNWGETMNYGHTVNVTYNLPLNKFPLTDWISLNTRYSVAYDWGRAPLSQDSLGHVVQNSRNINWNGQFNFTQLYNKVPYLKKVNQKYGRGGRRPGRGSGRTPRQPDPPKSDTTKTGKPKKQSNFNFLEQTARIIMSLKNISFTYAVNDGILLPGYGSSTKVLGMDDAFKAPGFGFILGEQNTDIFGRDNGKNFATTAAIKGWLVENENLNTQHVVNHAKNFNSRATLEPITGMRIELTADKNISENLSEFFRWDADTIIDGITGKHLSQNPLRTGMMSVSLITWGTAFEKDTSNDSKIFTNLRDNRSAISALLGQANPNSGGVGSDGYHDGYGGSSQDVIIGAFLSAYTGKGPSDKHTNPFTMIPLPNWRLTYDGLGKIKFMKKHFKTISFQHAYRSSFTVSNYTTNLESTTDAGGNLTNRDAAGNFISSKQIMAMSIAEQFSPLLGVDITMKNDLLAKFELKKDRNISLSLTNNQITEIKGSEMVIGSGYRFKKVKLNFIKIKGKALESDLNLRVDLSIRSNKTIIRKIIENQNQVTAGQRLISIKTAADYVINERLNIRFFYDQVITRPFVSTTFPTSNINSGLALRFTLAQ
jgi:cell surface protein SprA